VALFVNLKSKKKIIEPQTIENICIDTKLKTKQNGANEKKNPKGVEKFQRQQQTAFG